VSWVAWYPPCKNLTLNICKNLTKGKKNQRNFNEMSLISEIAHGPQDSDLSPPARVELAVFTEFERDILRDRVKAGIAQARNDGRPHGRPVTVGKKVQEIKKLAKKGVESGRHCQAAQHRPNLLSVLRYSAMTPNTARLTAAA
jgi:hypothetical protein